MSLYNWKYKKLITINNSNNPNTLTDYQIKIVLDTASLISAGKMKSDGSDIRVVDSNGSTLLNYWVEGINTISTKIWVKVPSIPALSTKEIYLYYGNPNATSQSSIANTFIREIDGIVGAWSLDEGTGTTAGDTSGNNNNGTISGATWTNSGKFNKALSFDGVNDYVNIPSLTWTPTAFTVIWWMKATTLSNPPYHVMTGVNGWGSFVFHTDYSNGSVFVGTDVNTRFTPTDLPAGTVELNNWVYFAYTYNGTQGRFYKNGQLIAGPKNQNLPNSWGGFMIGQITNGYGGVVDEVHIFNRALTQDEITDLYNNYGYSTTAYPGRVLVRKFSSPEPTTSVGYEIPLMGGGFLFNLV